MSNENDKILHHIANPEGNSPDYLFFCPGCGNAHGVWTTKRNGVGSVWKFNGSMDKPTFEPSLLVNATRDITPEEHRRIMDGEKLNIPKVRCHSYVRNGQIEYLGDCTHALAGKTVPMVAF